jgi:subtilisin family serine protease
MSGVAPRALLGNYNVFPGTVENARSEDIMNALEAAYTDGFDVANMSLGGNAHGIQDLLTVAVDNLDQANMVVAVSAGNEGPGHYTVGSPGSAARALTAGASTVGHGLFTTVTVAGTAYDAIRGDFGTYTVSGELAVIEDSASTYGGLSTACGPIAENLAGKIALISRGTCDFSVKILNAQNAGAVGVVVVNREPGIIIMGQGTPPQPTIPAYMVDLADRDALKASEGQFTSLDAPFYSYNPANSDIMGDFSSQGPTDVDFRVKPDVVAPGVNVLSSIPQSYCGGTPCFDFFNGTSMAAPHLAGSAAIVRQQHPTWTAAQVRSAIVNTADQTALRNFDAVTTAADVNIIGAGRENLLSAVNATVALDPVSISFGAVPSGSGQTQTFTLTLTNVTSSSQTFAVAVGTASGSGVTFSVAPASVSLIAGASGTVTVTLSADKGAALGDHQATFTVSSGETEVAHAAVYVFIK